MQGEQNTGPEAPKEREPKSPTRRGREGAQAARTRHWADSRGGKAARGKAVPTEENEKVGEAERRRIVIENQQVT